MWIAFRATIILIILLGLTTICSSSKEAPFRYKYRVLKSGKVMATAYNSMASQTDDTPWITASGTRCREGVIASNFLPIGTKVLIDGFGDQIFIVEDRMNKRYQHRIDIWFREYHEAMNFGIRKIKYHVIAEA
jgi:3D (Asp-Asp-Asp) domain-containing protein